MLAEQYHRPNHLQAALDILQNNPGTRVLAGGTDLIIALRERRQTAAGLLDLSQIAELTEIKREGEALHIGSMATFHSIELHPEVLAHCPILAMAASTVGAPQIRARATIGGNVANAAAAADSLPALLALDAVAQVASSKDVRQLPLQQLLVGLNQTSLAREELIVKFVVPLRNNRFMDFEKIGRRRALAISRVNLGLVAEMEKGRIERVAIAVGAVGKTAYRVSEVEESLAGKTLTPEEIGRACEQMDAIVAEKLAGRNTTPYKRRIAAAVLRLALEKLMKEATA